MNSVITPALQDSCGETNLVCTPIIEEVNGGTVSGENSNMNFERVDMYSSLALTFTASAKVGQVFRLPQPHCLLQCILTLP